MLILVSHIVKCVTTTIKASVKLCKYPAINRTIQRDCCLVPCLCDCVSPATAVSLSTRDLHPNVTTQSFLIKKRKKERKKKKRGQTYFIFLFLLCHCCQSWSSVWPPLLEISAFFPSGCALKLLPCSSLHPRSPKHQLLSPVVRRKLLIMPGERSWKLRIKNREADSISV